MNKFRVYCGPTCVKTLAQLLRDKGFYVTVEGTEHVYLGTVLTQSELFQAVKNLSFGLNYTDLQYLGVTSLRAKIAEHEKRTAGLADITSDFYHQEQPK